MPDKKYTSDAVVVAANEQVAPDHYVMAFAEPRMGAATQPGQFFQVRLKGQGTPFLPRPFSIWDWTADAHGNKTGFSVLYKVIGAGTQAMSQLKPGDSVAVTGPLGNGFTLPPRNARTLIAAGGVGIAPFLTFARRALESGVPPRSIRLLYGARCDSLLVEYARFAQMGIAVEVITDDGSCGAKGTVLDLLKKQTKGKPPADFAVYASGPTPMLNALAGFCMDTGIHAELSLEARMVCGFGACNSCAVAVKSGKAPDGWEYKLVCRDGPVFAASSLHIG